MPNLHQLKIWPLVFRKRPAIHRLGSLHDSCQCTYLHAQVLVCLSSENLALWIYRVMHYYCERAQNTCTKLNFEVT